MPTIANQQIAFFMPSKNLLNQISSETSSLVAKQNTGQDQPTRQVP
jgi:hypothetical protein